MGLENPVHLLFVAAVVLLVFGPRRLPEAGRAMGRGIREFKEGLSGPAGPDDRSELPDEPSPQA